MIAVSFNKFRPSESLTFVRTAAYEQEHLMHHQPRNRAPGQKSEVHHIACNVYINNRFAECCRPAAAIHSMLPLGFSPKLEE